MDARERLAALPEFASTDLSERESTPIDALAQHYGLEDVVLVTGHHLWFDTPAGDEVIAFALPKRK